jgi:nitroreductase
MSPNTIIDIILVVIAVSFFVTITRNYLAETMKIDTTKVNAVYEAILKRRTVREFESTPIPEEHITRILDAARYAPTAGNVQPWKFVVIKDKLRLDSLFSILKVSWAKKVRAKANMDNTIQNLYIEKGVAEITRIMTAPVYIFVFVDTTVYPRCAFYDGCVAVENLMLMACAMGYGTGFFTTFFPREVVRDFVHAPGNLKFLCATPLGIPKKWPKTPPKKDLSEFVVEEMFE